jgi:hypothetical protein
MTPLGLAALKALQGRAANPLYREPPHWLFDRDAYGDGRRAAVARLYGYLARCTALDPLEAVSLVRLLNEARSKPPLDDAELVAICFAVVPWSDRGGEGEDRTDPP